MRLLRTKCVACVGNRTLIPRSSISSEGRRTELVRVVACLQETSEIEVGRDRVGDPAGSFVTCMVSSVKDVALYEAHAGNDCTHT